MRRLSIALVALFICLAAIPFYDHVELRNRAEMRWFGGSGSNYKALRGPSGAFTATTTCDLEDDAHPIPDSCVGDGVDSGGSSNLDGLTDVTISSPVQGQTLIKGAGDWVNGPLDLADSDAVTGGLPDANLANNYSGIGACGANTWASTLNDAAAPTCTQPAFSNISGTAGDAQISGIDEADEVVGTEIDEALCSWETTSSNVQCDLVVNAGSDLTADLEEEAHCAEHDSADVDCSGEQIVLAADSVGLSEFTPDPAADDQVFVSDSVSAGTWRAIPNCNTEFHLTYNTTTNSFGCEADDGGGGGGLSYAQVAAAVMGGF